jgi:hypothetical protein
LEDTSKNQLIARFKDGGEEDLGSWILDLGLDDRSGRRVRMD